MRALHRASGPALRSIDAADLAQNYSNHVLLIKLLVALDWISIVEILLYRRRKGEIWSL